jgi:hypothetical protein
MASPEDKCGWLLRPAAAVLSQYVVLVGRAVILLAVLLLGHHVRSSLKASTRDS